MRKIETGHETKKRQKKNQIIVGFVLVALMVFSTLGFVLQFGGQLGGTTANSNTGTLNYNGLEFSYINGFWVLGNFVFRNNPQQVPEIGSGLKDIENYQGLPLYVYSESPEAEAEVSVNLGLVAERVQKACPEGEICSAELPVKNCTDNFIIIKEGISEIRQEENCVYITGTQSQLTALADQFLFKILGIK